MRNLSPLFTRNTDGFLCNLNLTDAEKVVLKEAKTKILERLRTDIAKILKHKHGVTVFPRFMSQGSSVYKTQNKPCISPPQQIDHDLGCYLPLTIIEETGRPEVAATVFFQIVDEILKRLVYEENWDGVSTAKKTCSRVIVNKLIHIDIPLYSIPDKSFQLIKEATAAHRAEFSISMDSLSDWQTIKEQVLLAHRVDGWKPSDPKKLNDYFKKSFQVKGEQLRRVCRYLKAWRDFKWKEGGPSSIYLMIIADNIIKSEINGRDDLALLDVLKGMSSFANGQVRNPAEPTEIISIDSVTNYQMLTWSEEFKLALERVIIGDVESCSKACQMIRQHLGKRFPQDSEYKNDIRDTVLNTPISDNCENRMPDNRSRAG
ncbi:CBASS cGAMP synthase [Chitinispirillales bacterium ANBcel5]|uniref:CBASS cGAMP synthase n=1 Tax=Cellulosispirillum alkaliphilum TaxID=3039283 RepID=UPI002A4EAFBB|nr:CBASS cGAMP synthase [Chitinispirillales bacterium ANBcel5]